MRVIEGRATVDDVDDFVERLGEIGDAHGVVVQTFDARYVVDREHLERAVSLADRAFDRGEAIARDRAVEILLYAAGRRQINCALAMGVGEGDRPLQVRPIDHVAGVERLDGDAVALTDGVEIGRASCRERVFRAV